jgi:hypothetical protein
LWRKILEAVRSGHGADRLAHLSAETRACALKTLTQEARCEHADPDAWQDLADFERLSGLTVESERHRAKAAALRQALDRDRSSIGRVLVAAVYTLNGKRKGLVHEIVARRTLLAAPEEHGPQVELLANVSEDLKTLVPRLLEITLDYARAHWPHRCHDAEKYGYTLRFTKEDEPSSGASVGLPVVVALLSVMLDRPVPQDLALTGAVTADSRRVVAIRRVGDVVYKIRGACHRSLRAILLSPENQVEVEAEDVVPREVGRNRVRFAATLDDAVEILWGSEAWEW